MERDDYVFMKIRDATTAINQKVNLIGVVVEFGFPKKTSGTDCFCKLKIVDESHPKAGIWVNVFAPTMEMLPHVGLAGDIIQLSRVMMKTFKQEIYAVFNKKFSSFALYKGKDDEDFVPYQYSSRFCQREQDKEFIAGLRRWLVDFKFEEGSDNFSFLREIKEGARVNLACKILHTSEINKDELMLYVWDGTDTPPASIHKKLEEERDNQLALQLEPFPLSRSILCMFPTVGTVFRVVLDKAMEKYVLHSLKIGEWVKLLDLRCEVNAGLWFGVLKSDTKLQYIPKEDDLILSLESKYNERLSLQWGRLPYWCFPWHSRLTDVDADADHAPFLTLMDVLTYSEVTAKFKCVARVVASFPWRAEDFRSPSGIYRIRFTLEDPTARIHAYVCGEDGERLFDGYPSVDDLRKKRDKLLGLAGSNNQQESENAPRNPPWVQICLKSYYLDKQKPWETRNYRIFGTQIVS